MADVSTLPPTVETQWETGVWADVTGRVHGLRVRHGAAAHSNPDRPSTQPAAGHLDLVGAPTAAQRSGRRPVRIRIGESVLWAGWMAEPRVRQGPPVTARWRLAGLLAEHLETEQTLNQPARTVADTLADDTLWTSLTGRPAAQSRLPARTLRAIADTDRCGGLVSRLAAVASAEPVERSDGTLMLSAGHPDTASGAAQVSTRAGHVVLSYSSRDRADLIRNRALVPGDVTTTDRVFAAVGRLESPATGTSDDDRPTTMPTAWTATFRPPAGSFDNWRLLSVAGSVEVLVYARTSGLGRDVVASSAVFAEKAITGVKAAAPVAGDGAVTVECSLDEHLPALDDPLRWYWDPTGSGRRVTMRLPRGPADFWTLPLEGRLWEAASVTASSFLVPTVQHRARVRALVATCQLACTQTAGSPDRVYTSGPSIAAWGVRPLVLPAWTASADDLQATLDHLGQLRREHTVTCDARQSPAVDAGDHIRLTVLDPGRGTDVDKVVLVSAREVAWQRNRPVTVTLRCAETGTALPAQAEAVVLTEDGAQLLLEDGSRLQLEDSTPPPAAAAVLTEDGSGMLLEDGSNLLLEA